MGHLKWRAIKGMNATSSDEPQSSGDGEMVQPGNLSPAIYNSVVYGLPHLALVLPTE